MIKYLFRLCTIALVSTLGVGGGVGLLVFIVVLAGKGDQHAWQYGLITGAITGLISTAVFFGIMMPLDLLFRWSVARNRKTNGRQAILENEQMRELILFGSTQKIHFACRQALLSIPGIKNVHDDAAQAKISATTGASWRCPGEIIEVEIMKEDAEKYLLRCLSRPAINKVVFDYGKNFENVEMWKERTQEFMKATSS